MKSSDSIDTIQSLWVGPCLGTMERLSVSSYLANGHPYHLYTYGEVKDIPYGAIVRDASEILPESDIKRFKNLTNFSDYWRYNLLWKRGGWWCDIDTVCLRPFIFPEEHVFSQEGDLEAAQMPKPQHRLSGSTMKAPAKSPVMRWLIDNCEKLDWMAMSWAKAGPDLVTKAAHALKLEYKPLAFFNPIAWHQCEKLIRVPAPSSQTKPMLSTFTAPCGTLGDGIRNAHIPKVASMNSLREST